MSFLGLQRTKKTMAENYDIISWVLCMFLGGMINVGILNATYAFLQATVYPIADQLLAILVLIGLIVFVVLLPLALSLILTAIQPELRIVPPFFITIISVAWFFVLTINPSNVQDTLFAVAILGMSYIALGYSEDWITTKVLGKAVERDSIYFEKLLVYGEVEMSKTE